MPGKFNSLFNIIPPAHELRMAGLPNMSQTITPFRPRPHLISCSRFSLEASSD